MSDKKHIDRLFQEKFKDFEAKPSANVWSGIQDKMELPQEKTKTVFPVWLRFASIAAALILLFTVGKIAFNSENSEDNSNTIVDSEIENSNTNSKNSNTVSNDNTDTLEDTNNIDTENEVLDNKTVVTNETNSKNNSTTSEVIQNKVNKLSSQSENIKGTINENNVNTNSSLANKNNSANSNRNGSSNINSEKKGVLNTSNNSQRLVQSNSTDIINTTTSNGNDLDKTNSNNNTTNNSTNSNNTTSIADNTNSTSNNPNTNGNDLDKTNINTNNTTSNSTNSNNTTSIADNTNSTSNNPNTKGTNTLDNNNATSNIVTTTDSEKEKEEGEKMEPDSANSSNAIEEALVKTEEGLDEKEEENVNRWSVNANIAPVYYNTLGKGSHIHDQFVDNPKNGEVNTSYGVNVGYALNDRLKVRSGINKLNLSYDTANVIVYENVSNTPSASSVSAFRNINFVPTSEGQNISVLSANNLSIQQLGGILSDDLNAALSQRLSYFEVPLELEYAVVKKRFGVNLIGGFSTFILNGNDVVTEVDNRNTKIGEANNINDISFSANAGIGIDYKFSKSLKFNFEPTFKYQINAYNETSGDFRPYIIGVYTGFSYKF